MKLEYRVDRFLQRWGIVRGRSPLEWHLRLAIDAYGRSMDELARMGSHFEPGDCCHYCLCGPRYRELELKIDRQVEWIRVMKWKLAGRRCQGSAVKGAA